MLGRPLSLVSVLIIALTLFGGAPAAAQSGAQWTDPDLTAYSDFVLTGKVISTDPGWDYAIETIYTYVTIEVDEVLKGWIPEQRIVLKQLGGLVGEMGLAIGGQAAFSPGEEVLLFLETRPRDGSLYTTALWEGKWSIRRGESELGELALRTESAADLDLADARFAGTVDVRSLLPFLEELRRWAGEESRRAPEGLRMFSPPEAPLASGSTETATAAAEMGNARISPEYSFLDGRWMEVDLGQSIPIRIHKKGEKGVSDKGFDEAVAAADIWSNAGSRLRLETEPKARFGRRKGCGTRLRTDGRILMVFRDPCDEMADGGGTLATGGFWYTCATIKVVKGVPFCEIVSGFLVTNSDSKELQPYLYNDVCFQEIITHELGHSLGLDHTSKKRAMMYGKLDNACLTASSARGLKPDDRKGLKAIYPK